MKQTEMIALGLAAVAVYLIVNTDKKTTTATSGGTLRGVGAAVSEIFDTAGKAFANGWRYFSDGTAIDPKGNYYQGGQLIWSNPTTQGSWMV
jgi:hypothetical protein